MRRRIALQKHYVRNQGGGGLIRFAKALGVRTRPRVAFSGLACQTVSRSAQIVSPAWPAFVLLRRGSPESLRGWRRGELNPCPRRYPRKHLHVYPAINSEEPSHAPAHYLFPSVREIDSRTGAVAPPVRQPAVHVFAASRRHCENVAVN